MNTNIENIKRRIYSSPLIDCVKLDNEISLVLESAQPEGDPTFTKVPEYFNNDPFRNNLA
jgi:hypothetical protein